MFLLFRTQVYMSAYKNVSLNCSFNMFNQKFEIKCIKPDPVRTRVGNFIIGASGSDKQMLCGSFVARAAPTISAVNKIKKKKVSLSFVV